MSELLADTNILLRYLTNEPLGLAQEAAALLEGCEQRSIAVIIPSLIVAEVVYVLDSVYGWERDAIAAGMLRVISVSAFTVPELAAVRKALEWYRDVRGLDFADAYLLALAASRPESGVTSFVRGLAKVASGIRVVADASEL